MADEILSGLKGIKTELRAVQDQMAGLDAGSQEFVKLSQKAGELRDKMKDVAEAVNANAGPAIGSFGNNLSIARGQLGELDITGFGESMKRMGANVKSVSFKDMGEGLKSVTGGFSTLGKALLTNPIFLIATAILGIVANFEKLTKAGGLVGKIFSAIGDFVNSAKEAFFAFTDAIGLTDMKADELAEKQKARNEKLKADSKTLNEELNKQREDNYKRTLSDRDREIRETTAKYQRLWELANGNAKKEQLGWEKEFLGLYISDHPFKEFSAILGDKVLRLDKLNRAIENSTVRIGGVISTIKKIITVFSSPKTIIKRTINHRSIRISNVQTNFWYTDHKFFKLF